MEFGRADKPINEINHSLPADGDFTKIVLDGKYNNCKFHVGLTRWGMKEWSGTLYPEKTKSAEFLKYYAEKFNSIELNSSFFATPSQSNIQAWNEKVAESGSTNFSFLPKASKEITHFRMLKDCGTALENFIGAVENFGKCLGPVFFQMGDKFSPTHIDRVEPFLTLLPKGHRFFFEVRNEKWFEDAEAKRQLLTLLHHHGVGTVISDTSGRRDALHMDLTTKALFLRFVGNGGDYWQSDFARVDEWIERINKWIAKGLEEVYFFVHLNDEAQSPYLASYIIDQLNEKCGAGLTPIKLNLP